jgi:hypothetical protein
LEVEIVQEWEQELQSPREGHQSDYSNQKGAKIRKKKNQNAYAENEVNEPWLLSWEQW